MFIEPSNQEFNREVYLTEDDIMAAHEFSGCTLSGRRQTHLGKVFTCLLGNRSQPVPCENNAGLSSEQGGLTLCLPGWLLPRQTALSGRSRDALS